MRPSLSPNAFREFGVYESYELKLPRASIDCGRRSRGQRVTGWRTARGARTWPPGRGQIAAHQRVAPSTDAGLLVTTQEKFAFTVFERTFKEFGLPGVIRTDNGVPFASAHAIYGLSKLSVWWLRLGIQIERIKPGHPQQNGRHERMHLTLKKEATKPAAADVLQQQVRFDTFVAQYNHERPHQALASLMSDLLGISARACCRRWRTAKPIRPPLRHSRPRACVPRPSSCAMPSRRVRLCIRCTVGC